MFHRKEKTRKLLSLALSIVMVLGLLPVGPFAPMEALAADPVSYIDADGSTKSITDYTVVSNSDYTWGDDGNDGWYVVNSDITVTQGYTVSGSVKLILVDGCNLTVTGAAGKAGIFVNGDSNSLSIYGQSAGTGKLEATGSSLSAGIGGSNGYNGSNITINGGTVTAIGGENGAGIGGGYYGKGSGITINGGTVAATSIDGGAGIGGGYGENGNLITINGGMVTATSVGSNHGDGIGNGKNASGNTEIRVKTTLELKADNNNPPTTVIANTGGDLAASLNGKRYVTAVTTEIEYQYPVYNTSGDPKTGIKEWKTGKIGGSGTGYTAVTGSSSAVTWSAGWYVVSGGTEDTPLTISGAAVNGDVHLILMDGCNLKVTGAYAKAGINVTNADLEKPTNKLTIYGQSADKSIAGKLTASGYEDCAGIGGNDHNNGSNITINGGTVTANGSFGGAGIGGGSNQSGSNITINGGNVIATSSNTGAGIGGGTKAAGSNIIINGGVVNASSKGIGAGIGGGRMGNGSNITINDGTVTADSGTVSPGIDSCGAGIGGGGGFSDQSKDGGVGINIAINGGTVTATGGSDGSSTGDGIGSGKYCPPTGSSIYAGAAVEVRAGDAENPTTVIEHTAGTHIGELAGKRYVTAGAPANYLTFTAEEAGATVGLTKVGSPNAINLQYSTDGGTTWNTYTAGNTITLTNIGNNVKFRGNNSTFLKDTDNYYQFKIEKQVAASGDVTSLTNSYGGDAPLTEGCYYCMFSGCTSLTTAPALPSTTLAKGCYCKMFAYCGSLTAAPVLPATTLQESCYEDMFLLCCDLQEAPALPSTTLAKGCYSYMFYGCSDLQEAPALPATTLEIGCYSSMFDGCTSLTEAPVLPATTLEKECYSSMFEGCTSLTEAPELKAMTLAESCYLGMFQDCTGLTKAPVLPATTLAPACYMKMFSGCVSLLLSSDTSGSAWSIPAATTAKEWNEKMFANTLCVVTEPENGKTYYQKATPWEKYWNRFESDSYIEQFGKLELKKEAADAIARVKVAAKDNKATWVVYANGTDEKYKTLYYSGKAWKDYKNGKSADELRSYAKGANQYVYVIGTVGKQTAITEVKLKNDRLVYDGTEKTVEIDEVKAGSTVLESTEYMQPEASVAKATDTGSYTLIVTGKGKYSGNLSKTWIIKKAGPAAPTGLEGVAPVTKDGSDGKVKGVTDKMEYKVNDGEWTDCTGTEITGLSASKVYVRVKETADTYEGTSAEVTVGAYVGFNVTYNNYYGNGTDKVVEVASGSNAKRPADPTCTRWNFVDWFKDAAGTIEWIFDGEEGADAFKIKEATTIYAKWEKEVYTATFDANGGSGSMDDMDTVDWKLTLPANEFTAPAGKKFAGWCVGSKMGEAKAPGTEVELIQDTVIYAMWVQDEFTVSFDANGGSGTMTDRKTADKKLVLPENSFTAPAGFQFAGWCVGSTVGETKNPGTEVLFTENTAVYALWTVLPVIGGGGSSTVTEKPAKTGTWGDPVTDGTWAQNADGTWTYKTNAAFKSTWGYIRNPYAKAGQPADGWYYFDANGKMLLGWQFINGKWYYLNPTSDGTLGMCYLNTTTPDGYKVDKNGAWIQ